MEEHIKVVATNRRATHDYAVLERFEAGIALFGSEIKSIRAGQINIKEGYISIEGRQAWLLNVHVSPYDPASQRNHDPLRKKRLLLHRKEILRLLEAQQQKGLAIIPLRIYLKRGLAKAEIGLGRGLKKYDKRQAIAKKDAERDMRRALSGRG
ncbi:MAG: SsrA-binding protein [Chloroflexi bacterium RBG_13_60_9]|nr:MAG: SsrA-binding protein [Chloroflexi bacterium RBG_13_60_9]